MMKVFLLAASLALTAFGVNPELTFASTALSPSGLESVMTFKAQVFLPEEAVPGSLSGNHQALWSYLIKEQTKHLLGVFEAPQFSRDNKLLSNNHLGSVGLGAVTNFKVIQETRVQGGWEITYLARERVLILKSILQPGQTRNIQIKMPHNPIQFYSRVCTDPEYFQKEYLFYYWNPYALTCKPELTGKNQVDTIQAQVRGLVPPSGSVTPRYDMLKSHIKATGELHISLLMGFNLKSSDPNDLGRQSYNYFCSYLEKMGFQIDHHRNTPTAPYVEYYRPASHGHFAVRVSINISASDIDTPVVFARRARTAFETSDVVLYAGHSGLGGNLDLEMITRLSSADPQHPTPIHYPSFYQIYYLDSCASFYFYSEQYALTNRGIHNVDIVSNGLASYFSTGNTEIVSFLNSFIQPTGLTSWNDILTSVESAAHHFSYMVNVQRIQ